MRVEPCNKKEEVVAVAAGYTLEYLRATVGAEGIYSVADEGAARFIVLSLGDQASPAMRNVILRLDSDGKNFYAIMSSDLYHKARFTKILSAVLCLEIKEK